MSDKKIWLPDSKTHVMIEDGEIRVWDTITMVEQALQKKSYGFGDKDKKD